MSFPLFETAEKIAQRLAARELSAVELCRGVIDHVVAHDPEIGAYSDMLLESALAEARASDRRRAGGLTNGPLDGIPIAVKDLIDTTPARCPAGLVHLKDYRPVADARVVKALRQAGAVILGVTQTDNGAFGTRTDMVKNPVAPGRIAGGSSGGSAAAVAAGMACAALGTDTGGSIRIPAACCSVAGFKPTWGRVATDGVRPLAKSLDHVGPVARSVRDLQIMQSALDPEGSVHGEPLPLAGLKIGLAEAYYEDADMQVQASMSAFERLIKDLRLLPKTVDLPSPDSVMAVHMVNLPSEAGAYHQFTFPQQWQSYAEIARSTVELGLGYSADQLAKTEAGRAAARKGVEQVLEQVDLLVLPVMPTDAPLREADMIQLGGRRLSILEATVRYTALFNQTGHPVVSIPAYELPDGRALSVQLVGPLHGDGQLLEIARKMEQALAIGIDYRSLVSSHRMRKNKAIAKSL